MATIRYEGNSLRELQFLRAMADKAADLFECTKLTHAKGWVRRLLLNNGAQGLVDQLDRVLAERACDLCMKVDPVVAVARATAAPPLCYLCARTLHPTDRSSWREGDRAVVPFPLGSRVEALIGLHGVSFAYKREGLSFCPETMDMCDRLATCICGQHLEVRIQVAGEPVYHKVPVWMWPQVQTAPEVSECPPPREGDLWVKLATGTIKERVINPYKVLCPFALRMAWAWGMSTLILQRDGHSLDTPWVRGCFPFQWESSVASAYREEVAGYLALQPTIAGKPNPWFGVQRSRLPATLPPPEEPEISGQVQRALLHQLHPEREAPRPPNPISDDMDRRKGEDNQGSPEEARSTPESAPKTTPTQRILEQGSDLPQYDGMDEDRVDLHAPEDEFPEDSEDEPEADPAPGHIKFTESPASPPPNTQPEDEIDIDWDLDTTVIMGLDKLVNTSTPVEGGSYHQEKDPSRVNDVSEKEVPSPSPDESCSLPSLEEMLGEAAAENPTPTSSERGSAPTYQFYSHEIITNPLEPISEEDILQILVDGKAQDGDALILTPKYHAYIRRAEAQPEVTSEYQPPAIHMRLGEDSSPEERRQATIQAWTNQVFDPAQQAWLTVESHVPRPGLTTEATRRHPSWNPYSWNNNFDPKVFCGYPLHYQQEMGRASNPIVTSRERSELQVVAVFKFTTTPGAFHWQPTSRDDTPMEELHSTLYRRPDGSCVRMEPKAIVVDDATATENLHYIHCQDFFCRRDICRLEDHQPVGDEPTIPEEPLQKECPYAPPDENMEHTLEKMKREAASPAQDRYPPPASAERKRNAGGEACPIQKKRKTGTPKPHRPKLRLDLDRANQHQPDNMPPTPTVETPNWPELTMAPRRPGPTSRIKNKDYDPEAKKQLFFPSD